MAQSTINVTTATGHQVMAAAGKKILRPGGKLLSHELLANDREEEIHQALATVIRANSTPLSAPHWMPVTPQD